jgi:hypothetical protein
MYDGEKLGSYKELKKVGLKNIYLSTGINMSE